MHPKTKEQGYLTFAQGDQYLQCAYLLALSVKLNCKINDFTVVVDHATDVANISRVHRLQPQRKPCVINQDADLLEGRRQIQRHFFLPLPDP